ncbi:MAG: response regulator [Roseiflexaceae bacterium]
MPATLDHILFVEDDPDIQAVAQLALEAVGGFRVTVCQSGREALAIAEQANPDLILLDVMMPEMDGPGTLANLRKLATTATTPVIFMTAKVQPHEVAQFRALGTLDVIAKPFDPMTLADTIRDRWAAHQASL